MIIIIIINHLLRKGLREFCVARDLRRHVVTLFEFVLNVRLECHEFCFLFVGEAASLHRVRVFRAGPARSLLGFCRLGRFEEVVVFLRHLALHFKAGGRAALRVFLDREIEVHLAFAVWVNHGLGVLQNGFELPWLVLVPLSEIVLIKELPVRFVQTVLEVRGRLRLLFYITCRFARCI